MSDRITEVPGGLLQDIWVYNADSVTIPRGGPCQYNASETMLKLSNNPMYTGERGPLEGTESVPVVGVLESTITASTAICGVAQAAIKSGEWGQIRVLGYGVAAVHESGSDVHMTAYGDQTGTDARLGEVNPTNRTFAYQIDASGATTAGTLRQVFINCLYGRGPKAAADHILGTAI